MNFLSAAYKPDTHELVHVHYHLDTAAVEARVTTTGRETVSEAFASARGQSASLLVLVPLSHAVICLKQKDNHKRDLCFPASIVMTIDNRCNTAKLSNTATFRKAHLS